MNAEVKRRARALAAELGPRWKPMHDDYLGSVRAAYRNLTVHRIVYGSGSGYAIELNGTWRGTGKTPRAAYNRLRAKIHKMLRESLRDLDQLDRQWSSSGQKRSKAARLKNARRARSALASL